MKKDKQKKEIEEFLINKPGYLKVSPNKLQWAMFSNSGDFYHIDIVRDVQKHVKSIPKGIFKPITKSIFEPINIIIDHPKSSNIPTTKKILFFDIETSPNQVLSWRIGNKVSLSTDNIIKERAIICISWKWQHEINFHQISWNKGNDYNLLRQFAKVMNSADIIVGHNSDNYDTKWVRTRCIKHNIYLNPKFNSIDTLKLARRSFNFNSNKLDYIGKFLNLGEKISTNYDLWKKVLSNDNKALVEMMLYCTQDVALLEKVYNKLTQYTPIKK